MGLLLLLLVLGPVLGQALILLLHGVIVVVCAAIVWVICKWRDGKVKRDINILLNGLPILNTRFTPSLPRINLKHIMEAFCYLPLSVSIFSCQI